MATLFHGMSKDSFLDELVKQTGKNGHELYDYLMSLIPEEEKEEKEMVLSNREGVPQYYKGTRAGLLEWARPFMKESDYDLLYKWQSSMAYGYFAQSVAAAIGLVDFTWVHTGRTMNGNNISIEYRVYWNNKSNNRDWSEKILDNAY